MRGLDLRRIIFAARAGFMMRVVSLPRSEAVITVGSFPT